MAFADDDRDRIRKAVSIVDLVSAVTTVKKSGRNHMAVCPFHQEKTPSMSLDVARGLFYCHGCHAKGDIFTFVQENEGLTFPETMERLASMAGITLTRDPAAERRAGQKKSLTEATAAAVEFYHRTLMKAPEAGHARSYLRNRGYGTEVVTDFKLGYAPHGERWDHLVRELRSQGIKDQVMIEAGLARKGRKGGLYDLFRDRVMFPTYDLHGSPVGFGGRVLGDGSPKYLNTPETPLYKKSELLYGMERARKDMQRDDVAVIVEGYTDVIALHRNGVPTAVATNGTALGEAHFNMIQRFAENVVLSFDPDSAGARAALRGEASMGSVGGSGVVTMEGLDIRVATLPDGMDPAEMVSSGRVEELTGSLRHEDCMPLREFVIRKRLAEVKTDNPEMVGPALESVRPLLSGLDEFALDEYARMIASIVGGDPQVIKGMLKGRSSRGGSKAPTHKRQPLRDRTERELLRAVLDDCTVLSQLQDFSERFEIPLHRESALHIIKLVDQMEEASGPVPVEMLDDEVSEFLVSLVMSTEPVGQVHDLITRLRVLDIEARLDTVRRQLDVLAPEEQTASPLAQELLALAQEKRDLEQRD